jgi:hypothetical protein
MSDHYRFVAARPPTSQLCAIVTETLHPLWLDGAFTRWSLVHRYICWPNRLFELCDIPVNKCAHQNTRSKRSLAKQIKQSDGISTAV